MFETLASAALADDNSSKEPEGPVGTPPGSPEVPWRSALNLNFHEEEPTDHPIICPGHKWIEFRDLMFGR